MSEAAIANLNLTGRSLLRPQQLEVAIEERESLEGKMKSSHTQDRGEVAKQLRRLDTSLKNQTPVAFADKDMKVAIKLEEELRTEIIRGMPSYEEMRKNPPGAVDKHMAWEKRTKRSLAIWKEVKLRMTAGSGDIDAANFERHRPRASTLNLDSAQIQGTSVFLPPEGADRSVAFSDEQIALIRKVNPELGNALAMLSNSDRAVVKAALNEKESIRATEPATEGAI